MTQREKVMATTLLVIMAVMGGGVFFHLFLYQPIADVRARLAEERDGLTKEQEDLVREEKAIEKILRSNPRLTLWKELSLPPKDPKAKPRLGASLEERQKNRLQELAVKYDEHLDALLRKSGFQEESIAITPRTANRRPVGNVQNKEILFEPLSFTVQARGEYQAVVNMLKAFHTTPLMHQIRTFTVSQSPARAPNQPKGLLDVNITVEALVITGGQEREKLLPEKLPFQPRVLAEPGRSYDLMVKRNMFTGIAPVKKEGNKAKESNESKTEVLRFVKLTMLFYNPDRRRWEATFYDQAKGLVEGKEKKVNERILNELTVNDSAGNEVLKAKIVKIDEEQLIFESDGQYFRMRCGDFIYPSIREPLKEKELRDLKIVTQTKVSRREMPE